MNKGLAIGNNKVNLLPFSGWMVVFVLVPIALVVYYAFTDVDGFTLENPRLKDVKLLIGAGEEDFAYNDHPIGIPATMRALKEKGLPFVSYFVPGSHDWYTWGELFRYFAQTVLWK